MHAFASILFHMNACDANGLCGLAYLDLKFSPGRVRAVILGDLISLCKVWVKVVLSRELAVLMNFTFKGEASFDR